MANEACCICHKGENLHYSATIMDFIHVECVRIAADKIKDHKDAFSHSINERITISVWNEINPIATRN